MSAFKKIVAATALAASALAAHATTTELAVPGQWYAFDVADGLSESFGTEWIDIVDGSALSFTFTITAPMQLRVVDAGFAGDSFHVSINGVSQLTSAVAPGTYGSTPNVGLDFDAAWANAAYSQGSWLLSAPGTYTVTGWLAQSVTDGGSPLNATVGGVMLTAPVPEPGTWALMLAGLGALGFAVRRRA